ncbi:uroporphyrinogen-III synthase [Arsenophonus symbiont of Ornithomya chloropus]|uniref:uroporphyrinogen-III synthase n=1 Tax=Arsenophonus symbiont of Ornithomya chloropus TaxID=634121 RepID=UPI0032B2D455
MSVLITKPNPSGKKLLQMIRSIGIPAVHIPLIKIIPSHKIMLLPIKLNKLNHADLIFFYQKTQ